MMQTVENRLHDTHPLEALPLAEVQHLCAGEQERQREAGQAGWERQQQLVSVQTVAQ